MQFAANVAMSSLPNLETRKRATRPGMSGSTNAGRATQFGGAHRNVPINHTWMEGPVQAATQLFNDPQFANVRYPRAPFRALPLLCWSAAGILLER